jgi:hypothetical protein
MNPIQPALSRRELQGLQGLLIRVQGLMVKPPRAISDDILERLLGVEQAILASQWRMPGAQYEAMLTH